MSRVEDVPIYAQRSDTIAAPLYNLWRRARLHWPGAIRLKLADHPGVAMILEEQAWICVNEWQGDLPILAWVEFAGRPRNALHLPVPCKLNYYHFAASRLRATVLKATEEALKKKLCSYNESQSS